MWRIGIVKFPNSYISHNTKFRNIMQSAVGHCVFFFFPFLHHFQINHAPDPLLLFNFTVRGNNKETKVEEIACPTSVIVTERPAIILYLYSALEICAFCCKCSLIQGQTNIPPTPYMTHIEPYCMCNSPSIKIT